MSVPPQLAKILEPAYPCPEFEARCKSIMRWEPKAGHVPRGYYGAIGNLDEVELILVVAEPGDPHAGEFHPEAPDKALNSAYEYAGSFESWTGSIPQKSTNDLQSLLAERVYRTAIAKGLVD